MKNKILEFDHVAISVSDIQRSVSWYSENLFATTVYQDETWALLTIGESKIALVSNDMHPPHIAFKLSDPGMFPEGLSVKTHRDGSDYVYFEDPDKNVVELIVFPLSSDG